MRSLALASTMILIGCRGDVLLDSAPSEQDSGVAPASQARNTGWTISGQQAAPLETAELPAGNGFDLVAEFGFDFSAWPTATEKPVPVSIEYLMLCSTTAGRSALDSARKTHGPHAGAEIVVRVNREAMDQFKARQPLPEGSVVVKEKHPPWSQEGAFAYAAMIKRELDYDPANGDWEYVFVDRSTRQRFTRGRIESCIACHRNAAEKDYLFRSYLPPADTTE